MEHYNFTGKSALIVHIATDTLIAQKKVICATSFDPFGHIQ